jgi:neutral amino acid transport system permease protein
MNWSFIFTRTFSEMIGPLALFYILGAQGLNIHYGYTGLLNFGQAGFMATGAYSVAICCATPDAGGYGWPLWVGLIVAVVTTTLFALLLGIPTLRLRGDYLAIVTIAAAEILRIVLRSEALEDFSGGNSGINGFARGFYDANPFVNGKRYEFGPFSYLGKDLWVMCVGWFLVFVAAMLTFLLMRSPWGRVLRSIRENEDAVRSLGKNVFSYKMQSLVIGALMGAAGGVVLALYQNLASPDDFGTKATFIAYTALILGGAARVGGPIIGGMIFYGFFTFLQVAAGQATSAGLIPKSVMDGVQAGIVPFIFLGISLMLLVIFRPQGIFGDRREIELDG